MIVWLDQKIFGNGFGLDSPYYDDRYLWLGGKRGTLYTFSPGFGAQLYSFQWTHPKPGEQRELGGYRFRVFSTSRRWGRVHVAWSYVFLPDDIDAANAALRKMKLELGEHHR